MCNNVVVSPIHRDRRALLISSLDKWHSSTSELVSILELGSCVVNLSELLILVMKPIVFLLRDLERGVEVVRINDFFFDILLLLFSLLYHRRSFLARGRSGQL
jgi:hypothetical protein